MDSKMKLVAITCISLVVATILGIVALMKISQNREAVRPVAPVQETDDRPEVSSEEAVLCEMYQLNPDKDPYAFMDDADFFDQPVKEKLPEEKKAEQVSLLVSSVQKDIRVHIVGSDGKLLTGETFEVMVFDSAGNAQIFDTQAAKQENDTESEKSDEKETDVKKAVYEDIDQDGIVYIAGVTAGDYHISLKSKPGYAVPKKATPISVSNDISYSAISDISFLIKSEEEIDAAVEDSAQNEAENDADGTESNVMRLNEGATVFGIDVSKWNKTIDWKKVKDAGVEFAIIRLGYRGSSTGALVEDPYFKKNMEGALDAGVRVGVYFFTQAVTSVEAVEEASMVLALCKDYKVSFPMYIDTEGAGGNGRADKLSVDERTQVVKAFCETIENEGHTAGVYASKHWFENRLHDEQLKPYQIWLAQYSREATYDGEYGMWQYTSAGKIDGINTLVDFNVSYMDY